MGKASRGKVICGIDPGLRGAIAYLATDVGTIIDALDYPTLQLGKTRKQSLDYHQLVIDFQYLNGDRLQISHVFIEKTWNRPNQGWSGALMFVYGATLGILAALGIPWTEVSPQSWKKRLQVPAAKDGARARASQLIPNGSHLWRRVKDDGRAEASLIALYGFQEFQNMAAGQ